MEIWGANRVFRSFGKEVCSRNWAPVDRSGLCRQVRTNASRLKNWRAYSFLIPPFTENLFIRCTLLGQEIRHGNSRARARLLQKLWAQDAARRAPHLNNCNSKLQPANEQLQLQPAAAEQPQPQPQPQPPEAPVEQQPAGIAVFSHQPFCVHPLLDGFWMLQPPQLRLLCSLLSRMLACSGRQRTTQPVTLCSSCPPNAHSDHTCVPRPHWQGVVAWEHFIPSH